MTIIRFKLIKILYKYKRKTKFENINCFIDTSSFRRFRKVLKVFERFKGLLWIFKTFHIISINVKIFSNIVKDSKIIECSDAMRGYNICHVQVGG